MRSMHLITGISIFSGLVIAVGIGCSSSSSKSPTTVSDAATTTDGGDGGEDAETCTLSDAGSLSSYMLPANTPEAGIALWDCEKAACTADLATCAADTCCNALIVNALTCSNIMGASAIITCFGPVLESSDMTATTVAACLKLAPCGLDAGLDAATTASDAATTTTDAASDAATTTTTDASGDGAVEQ
jgi:hypothetical protein